MKLYSVLILIFLFLYSCQKEDGKREETGPTIETVSPKSESELLRERIGNAYNIDKYKTEPTLKYSVDVVLADTTYFNGVFRYKISEKTLEVNTNGVEYSIPTTSKPSKKEEFLRQINDIYTLAFHMKNEGFKMLERNDSIVKSRYLPKDSAISYEIYTHPLTEIMQSLSIKGSSNILDNTILKFEKYITVNRIPVSMNWVLFKDKALVGTVNISRISYPKD